MSQFSSHSADVEIWLDCGEHGCVPLSRITPKSVVAKLPREVPGGVAELLVIVNGRRLQKRIHLPRGFTNGRQVARIRPVEGAPF